ncbi:MAG: hypothetical protein JSW61_11845 [Candidatus Thorarchaeota archaeon]|nr:MAG: hypothetical protein JSW61_11845 [Candidatus Thorarchaeota archaeon]
MAEIPVADPGAGYGVSDERPLGVTILALLQFLGGAFMLVTGILATLAGMLFILLAVFGMIMVILGFISLIVGWGLWSLKSWAWTWAIIVNILNIIVGIIPPLDYVSLAIAIIIVLYLNQPDIKRRFR